MYASGMVVLVWVKTNLPFLYIIIVRMYIYTLQRYNNNVTPNAFPSGKRRIVFGFASKYVYIYRWVDLF